MGEGAYFEELTSEQKKANEEFSVKPKVEVKPDSAVVNNQQPVQVNAEQQQQLKDLIVEIAQCLQAKDNDPGDLQEYIEILQQSHIILIPNHKVCKDGLIMVVMPYAAGTYLMFERMPGTKELRVVRQDKSMLDDLAL